MITSANQCGHMIFRAPWNAENGWLRQALNNRKNWIHLLSLITGVNISKRSTGFLTLAGAFWVSFVAIGFLILAEEQFTPVKATPRVTLFPPNCGFQLVSDKPTLVLFAHPHCPCTRASLHELAVLIAQTKNRVSAIVVFTIPDCVPAGWEQGDLWDSAKTIPGVHVIRDPGGREALRFDVEGSGHVLLYAPSGKLLFSGGITGPRGHEGDNVGRSAVVSFILEGHASITQTPVFGCSLL
jgi:hypothetical protein